jgi:large subunit ribosomal protein L30
MRYIEIEQIGSAIRRHHSQRQTLIGLKLNRIGRVQWVPDTPATRGMIKTVRHLVRINHDPAAPKPATATPVPDEAADVQLMRVLAFDRNGIVLEPYDDAALKRGKTPDFKLMKDGKLCGFCEMKSPRDDFIFEAPEPGGVAVRKNLPFYRKLGSFVINAAKQFDAENSARGQPNILVFVSHTPVIERRDLIATIVGLPVPGGKPVYLLGRKMQNGQYSNPVRVIAFNTAEGWSRDVSEDVPHELHRRCAEQARDLPSSLEQFVDRYQGQHRAL